jgi:excisionase family DNA binding protein
VGTDEHGRRLLRVDEAAERLTISASTTRRLIARGDLPAVKVGHSLRVPEDELEEWLFGQPPEAAA